MRNEFSIVDIAGIMVILKIQLVVSRTLMEFVFVLTQPRVVLNSQKSIFVTNKSELAVYTFLTKTDEKDIVFGKNELINKLIDFKEISYSLIKFNSINSDKNRDAKNYL